MSNLIKEDETYLYLVEYLHNDSDERPNWVFNKDGISAYPFFIEEADAYAFYEIKVEYRINKYSGEVLYDRFAGRAIEDDSR